MNSKPRSWRDVLFAFTQVEVDQISCPSCHLPVLEYQYSLINEKPNLYMLYVWCKPCAEGASVGRVPESNGNKVKDQAKIIPHFRMVLHLN